MNQEVCECSQLSIVVLKIELIAGYWTLEDATRP